MTLAPSPSFSSSRRHAPVTLDDLRQVEASLYQGTDGRFTTTQRVFFEALLAQPDMDEKIAAKQSGVGLTKARRWLKQPAVQAALNHLLTQRMQRLGIDKDALLHRLVDLLDMAMGAKQVTRAVYDKDLGGFISQKVVETDLAAAARFTDQLGRHFQLFQPDTQIGTQVNISMNFGADHGAAAAVNSSDLAPNSSDLDAEYEDVTEGGS